MTFSNLETDLSSWDLKSVAPLEAIYRKYGGHEDFVTEIVRLSGVAPCQRAATWLLKHHVVDCMVAMPTAELTHLYAQLAALDHWEAKLHVLQCLFVSPIPKSDVERVDEFLKTCLGAEAKFVRAWAYSALHRLAQQFPAYRATAAATLKNAQETETSAAVKVRIRKAIEAGF